LPERWVSDMDQGFSNAGTSSLGQRNLLTWPLEASCCSRLKPQTPGSSSQQSNELTASGLSPKWPYLMTQSEMEIQGRAVGGWIKEAQLDKVTSI
jgi:hypothetical protein